MNRVFKDGEIVLFQGDSITDCGRDRENKEDLAAGYAGIVANIYKNLFPGAKVTFVNRGINGNRTKELLERYEEDIKQVAPGFISILIGINDVWRRFDKNDPTSVEQFEENYRTLLMLIKRDLPLTKIMLIEPFVLHTLEERKMWHTDLDPKIQVVRKLAAEYADYYFPLDGIMQKATIETYTMQELSEDGVHPTLMGHRVIAGEYLKTIGVV